MFIVRIVCEFGVRVRIRVGVRVRGRGRFRIGLCYA